jgi:hypothetical protein
MWAPVVARQISKWFSSFCHVFISMWRVISSTVSMINCLKSVHIRHTQHMASRQYTSDTHCTWLADSTCTHHWQLNITSHSDRKTCIVVANVCRQDVWTCFMSGASCVAPPAGRHCTPYRQLHLSLVTARWPGRTPCARCCWTCAVSWRSWSPERTLFLALLTVEGSHFTEQCNIHRNPQHIQITWLNETRQTTITHRL